MSTEAGWPIVVGGVYKKKGSSTLIRRVTAIDGDTVYVQWVGGSEGTNDLSMEVFREMYRPEDQSPLPRVRKLLERLIESLEIHRDACATDRRSMCIACKSDAVVIAEARALLAELGGAA